MGYFGYFVYNGSIAVYVERETQVIRPKDEMNPIFRQKEGRRGYRLGGGFSRDFDPFS